MQSDNLFRITIEKVDGEKTLPVETFDFVCPQIATTIRLLKLLLKWEIEDAFLRTNTQESFVSKVMAQKDSQRVVEEPKNDGIKFE